MPFVQAKCPNCGGVLAVDNSNDAAICPFCNTPYIVEKAINNYNVTVNGNVSVENANITVTGAPTVSALITRAESFIKSNDYEKALEYYNKALDLEPNNAKALQGVDFITVANEDNLLLRRKSGLLGCAVAIVICIDGKEVCSLKNGESSSLKVKVGKHTISARNSASSAFAGEKEFYVSSVRVKTTVDVSFQKLGMIGLTVSTD